MRREEALDELGAAVVLVYARPSRARGSVARLPRRPIFARSLDREERQRAEEQVVLGQPHDAT